VSEPPGEAPAPPVLSGAADRLREAARWLVVAFGAVAAAAFAGIGINRYGDLDPGTDLGLFTGATVAALLALAGAVVALFVSMSLAAASTVSVADLLADDLESSITSAKATLAATPFLSRWDGDLAGFFAEVEEAHKKYLDELETWATSTSVDAPAQYASRAQQRMITLDGMQAQALETASYLRLRARFQRARWWLAGSLTVATVSAVAYVWLTGPAAAEHVARTPVTAVWTVPAGDRDRIREALGDGCALDVAALPVVVLDEEGDGKEAEVLTEPRAECQPLRLTVGSAQVQRVPE
jgi:hypothetical protein